MAIERELTSPEQEAFDSYIQGLERQASDPLITRLTSDDQARLIRELIVQTGAGSVIRRYTREESSGESTQ